MKKILITILLSVISTAMYSQSLPNTVLEAQNGKEFKMEDLIDGETPIIISFWSTTCKNCIKELDAIYESFEDWSEEINFKVVAVSTDDSRSVSRAKSMANSRGWTDYFTLLYDKNQDLKRALNVNLIPHIFVFDKNGKQVYSHTGYMPGSEMDVYDKLVEISK